MKEIPLTNNNVAIIDDEDFNKISKYNWRHMKSRDERTGYAVCTFKGGILGRMHRFILGLKKGDKRQVDHINGNGLDNRRFNLRICAMSENLYNRPKNKNNTSGYKGVYWYPRHKQWAAKISLKGNQIFIGMFKDKKDAALAYNEAAIQYHGNFARLNIIGE